ncbi:MAG: 6-phosphogluconolactonase [Crocinitomicaceae bacterium]
MRTKHFKSIKELENALLEAILRKIDLSIDEHGDARILLSGGNTPRALYSKMAESEIDWSKVIIGLVDDRNVDLSSRHSNERMIRDIFKSGSEIIGLVHENPKRNLVKKHYAPFFERIDYTILGMGEDGHTASLFPDDLPSEASLRSSEKDIVFTTAPNFPNERISCSRGLILSSKIIGLMIVGERKLSVLNNSGREKLPISYFTNSCQQLTTYYCKS